MRVNGVLVCTRSGAAAGAGAGIFLAGVIPRLAVHIGAGGHGGFALLVILVPAGILLGVLLARLLVWAGADSTAMLRGATLPWLAVLFVPAALLLPGDRFGMTGSILGPAKHALSAAWMLGVCAYATFLLRPLLAEYHPFRLAAGFTAVVWLIALCLAIQPPNESDEADYVAASLALLSNASMRVDHIVENGDLDAYYEGSLPPTWMAYRYQLEYGAPTVNRYSYRLIGYPLLLSPFLALSRTIVMGPARWFVAGLPGIVGYFLLVWALAILLEDKGAGRARALIACATMTPFLYFPSNLQPEIWMAAAVAALLVGVSRVCMNARTAFLFGLLAALSLLLHERMAVPVTCALLAALAQPCHRRLLLSGFALGLIPVCLAVASVLQWQVPHVLPHAYGKGSSFFNPSRWEYALVMHALSFNIGLLPRLPVLGLLAVLPFIGRRAAIPAGLVLPFVIFVVYAALIITYPAGLDSWPHLRYMVPILPTFAPFLGWACSALDGHRWGRTAYNFALGLQVALAWPFLAVPQLWRWFL